ncbi:protein C19orf12-like [Melanerpes formicivorus]|uniref:protein C19orf12-like n=1 Tax=Melanerpes formicivorus TaxID=211600 RepID=UPI00358F639E
MPIYIQDVMDLFSHLAKVKGMKAAVIHSGKRALVAGASAFTGGILAGPLGTAVGAAVGVILGTWIATGQSKSVPVILSELPSTERKKLYDEAMAILRTFNVTDAFALIPLVMGNAHLQQRFTQVLINYFSKELNAKLKCSK